MMSRSWLWGLLLLVWGPQLYARDIIEITGAQATLVYLYAGEGMDSPFGSELIHQLRWSGLFEVVADEDDADITLSLVTQGQVQKTQILDGEGEFLMTAVLSLPLDPSGKAVQGQALHIIKTLTGNQPRFNSAIAYVTKSKKQGYRIELTDYFGKRQKTLAVPGGAVLLPKFDWSGKRVLYTHLGELGARARIHYLETGDDQPLDNQLGETIEVSFSPNKNQYYMALIKRGNSDLYRYDRSSGVLYSLTSRSATDSSPALSLDGSKLLFVSNRSGTVQIYQKDLENGEVKRMTFEGSYNAEPVWDPTGRYLAFAGLIEGRFEIFLMDRRGLKQKRLTFGPGSSETTPL